MNLTPLVLAILPLGALAASQDPSNRPEGPAPGKPAPQFELKTPDGKRSVSLKELTKERPVALVFGSWT